MIVSSALMAKEWGPYGCTPPTLWDPLSCPCKFPAKNGESQYVITRTCSGRAVHVLEDSIPFVGRYAPWVLWRIPQKNIWPERPGKQWPIVSLSFSSFLITLSLESTAMEWHLHPNAIGQRETNAGAYRRAECISHLTTLRTDTHLNHQLSFSLQKKCS